MGHVLVWDLQRNNGTPLNNLPISLQILLTSRSVIPTLDAKLTPLDAVLRVSHESTDVEVLAVAWHPFGRLAASSASDGSVEVRARVSQIILCPESALDSNVQTPTDPSSSCFSALLSDFFCATQVWDLEQQRSIQQFGLPQDTACILEFTPDGRQLLVGTLEGGILTWDLQTARRTGQLELFGGDSAAAGWISLHPQLGMAAVLSGERRRVGFFSVDDEFQSETKNWLHARTCALFPPICGHRRVYGDWVGY